MKKYDCNNCGRIQCSGDIVRLHNKTRFVGCPGQVSTFKPFYLSECVSRVSVMHWPTTENTILMLRDMEEAQQAA